MGSLVAVAIQESKETASGIAIPDHGLFHVDADRAANRAENAAREGNMNFADLILARRDMVDGYMEARPLTASRTWKHGVIVGFGPDAYDIEFGDLVFINTKHSAFWNGLSRESAGIDCRDDEHVQLCDHSMKRMLSIDPTTIAILTREELCGGLVVATWNDYALPATNAVPESKAA